MKETDKELSAGPSWEKGLLRSSASAWGLRGARPEGGHSGLRGAPDKARGRRKTADQRVPRSREDGLEDIRSRFRKRDDAGACASRIRDGARDQLR